MSHIEFKENSTSSTLVGNQLLEIRKRVSNILIDGFGNGSSDEDKNARLYVENERLVCQRIAGVIESENFTFSIRPKIVDLGRGTAEWLNDFKAMTAFAEGDDSHLGVRPVLASKPWEVIAGELLALLEAPRRQSLWGYSAESWVSFRITGQVDPNSVALPSPEGYMQYGYARNDGAEYRGVLTAAILKLAARVPKWPYLGRLISFSDPSLPVLTTIPQLPDRFDEWQPVYSLCKEIIKDAAISVSAMFQRGGSTLFATEVLWERLSRRLTAKASLLIGESSEQTFIVPSSAVVISFAKSGHKNIQIKPDIGIFEGKECKFIIDAKYKSFSIGRTIVSKSDFYQAIAFLDGTSLSQICLIYPEDVASVGARVRSVETIEVLKGRPKQVRAIAVNIRDFGDHTNEAAEQLAALIRC